MWWFVFINKSKKKRGGRHNKERRVVSLNLNLPSQGDVVVCFFVQLSLDC